MGKRLSPDSLTEPTWHTWAVQASRGSRRLWVECAIPLVLGGAFLLLGWWIAASLVIGIAVVLLGIGVVCPAAKARVDRWIDVFAGAIAKGVSFVLLAPVFFTILPLVRIWHLVTGQDPLRLRAGDAHSFWMPAENARRRRSLATAMFCAEARRSGKPALLPWVAIGVSTLLVMEAGLRIYGLGSPLKFVQDPDVGYYPAAHQKARYPGRLVTTNNCGMRSADVVLPKPPGVLRILLIGDSTLAGTRVANHQLYSALLEKHLAGKTNKVVEVLNLGVNAWGPRHQLGYIGKFGIFDADIVVVCGPVANVFRPKYGLERMPFFPAGTAPRSALEHVAYELIWRVREHVLGPPQWTLEGPVQDAEAAAGVDAYAGIARLVRDHGAEIMIEMMPARATMLGGGSDPFGERMFGPIRERLESMGVETHLAEAIFSDQPRKEEIFYDGVHFDQRGHQLYSAFLAGRLMGSSKVLRENLKH